MGYVPSNYMQKEKKKSKTGFGPFGGSKRPETKTEKPPNKRFETKKILIFCTLKNLSYIFLAKGRVAELS